MAATNDLASFVTAHMFTFASYMRLPNKERGEWREEGGEREKERVDLCRLLGGYVRF